MHDNGGQRSVPKVAKIWSIGVTTVVSLFQLVFFFMIVGYVLFSDTGLFKSSGNYHPVFMTLGIVMLMQGVMSYDSLEFFVRKERIRTIHALVQISGFLFLIIGVILIYSSGKAYAPVSNGHSVLGITLLGLFAGQGFIGMCKYITIPRGRHLHQWHGRLGLFLLAFSLVQLGLGVQYIHEGLLGVVMNTAAAYILYGILIALAVLVLFFDGWMTIPRVLAHWKNRRNRTLTVQETTPFYNNS
eukprot:TRINITY_DN1985_c1_g1_i1.p1 TRINITY_DN1985_c1_g1~~TRINITY_DN1985_c1_g1_i1.p1  ORF type:complete len:270 (+),score=79.89 TRINITY_DN1985_c1_g1_i1:84-812(+)